MKKIIIIRGKSGAGKTTISYELAKVLPKYFFVDIWKFKEMFEPFGFKNRKPQNEICKESMFFIIKQSLKKNLFQNFIIQESSQSSVRKYMKNYLDKKDKIYSFFLDVDLKNALKRNVEREKTTMDKKHFIEQSKQGLKNKEKEDILIDTSNKSIKQVIDIILKNIGEKRTSKKLNLRKCV